jgi:hypothetical protein
MEMETEKYVHCTLYYCLVLHLGLVCAWSLISLSLDCASDVDEEERRAKR